jgi:oligoribonuclease (3'-5' exoribonuclease)
MSTTLYWHDYETFGRNPRWCGVAQFAGIRTDEDLNEVGEPLDAVLPAAARQLARPRRLPDYGHHATVLSPARPAWMCSSPNKSCAS